jgi:hypothetical protein
LLYDEGYTIPGARQAIKSEMKQSAAQLALAMPEGSGGAHTQQLRMLHKELKDLLTMLSKPPGARGGVTPFRQPRAQRPAGSRGGGVGDGKDLFGANAVPRED